MAPGRFWVSPKEIPQPEGGRAEMLLSIFFPPSALERREHCGAAAVCPPFSPEQRIFGGYAGGLPHHQGSPALEFLSHRLLKMERGEECSLLLCLGVGRKGLGKRCWGSCAMSSFSFSPLGAGWGTTKVTFSPRPPAHAGGVWFVVSPPGEVTLNIFSHSLLLTNVCFFFPLIAPFLL